MTIKDGGPAFACAAENGHQPGMSRREWFAGQALPAVMDRVPTDLRPQDWSTPTIDPDDVAANQAFAEEEKYYAESIANYPQRVAARCYAIADAMIAESERGK